MARGHHRYRCANHDAASKFFVQKFFRLDIHHRVIRLIPIDASLVEYLLSLFAFEELPTTPQGVSEIFISLKDAAREFAILAMITCVTSSLPGAAIHAKSTHTSKPRWRG
jgi:hypothetical protein